MKFILSLIIILLLCLTPVYAEKNKGLFSGDILQADLDAFTDSTADIPSYADQQTPEKTNLQDIGEWIEIGKSQLKSGNWAGAEESFSRVTKQEPDNDIGWEGYLLAIRGGGDFHKLLATSEEAAQKNPDYGAIWKYQGIAFSGLDKPEEALSAFDKALEIDPNYNMALYYKGLALVSLKRYTEAVSAFEQVVKAEPAYAKAWNNMGVAFNYLGKYEDAINAFDKAYELDPSFTQAYENRAIAVEEQKQGNLGLGDIFDDALSLTPSKPVVTIIPTEVPLPPIQPSEVPTAIITTEPIFTPQSSPVPTPVVPPEPIDPIPMPSREYQTPGGSKGSQPPDIVWQNSIGGSEHDHGMSIVQTGDGGYILTGDTLSSDGDVTGYHGGRDVWVVKLDDLGTIMWQKCLGGSDYDEGNSIILASDGGYILTGSTRSNDGDVIGNHVGYPSSFDVWVVKLGNAGNILWQKCLGGSGNDYGNFIAPTNEGGFILIGSSETRDGDVKRNNGEEDVWVVKLDNSGTIVWQKSLGGNKRDNGFSIAQTIDGGYILIGWTESRNGDVIGNHGGRDVWVVKLDNLGDILWQKSLGGSEDDNGYSITPTSNGGYILTGWTSSNDGDVEGNHGKEDVWVVKLDGSGNIIWQKCLGGNDSDKGYSIIETSDEGYILTGDTRSKNGDVKGNHGSSDAWLVKLDSSGTLIWQRCLGGSKSGEIGNAIVPMTEGGFILVGDNWSNDGDATERHGGSDVWVIKLK